MYAKYMKRLLDILLSLTILVVLSPLLLDSGAQQAGQSDFLSAGAPGTA